MARRSKVLQNAVDASGFVNCLAWLIALENAHDTAVNASVAGQVLCSYKRVPGWPQGKVAYGHFGRDCLA